jgi:uncharacterized protein YgbK (DUF1537 family)
MTQLAIIADDLTGANDTGVQFSKRAIETLVIFAEEKISLADLIFPVLVYSSDSRGASPSAAYQTVFQFAQECKTIGIRHIFKKLDSTLRGNLGAEIDAIMDVYTFPFTLFIPAYPNNGRVTQYGVHYVNGVPISESEFAVDPIKPVMTSFIPDLLRQQTRRTICHIDLQVIRQGAKSVEKSINEYIVSSPTAPIIVLDAARELDLQTINEAANTFSQPFLWAGSAGIANYIQLTKKTTSQLQSTGSTQRIHPYSSSPILLVAGSLSPVTHRQIDYVKEIHSFEEWILSEELLLTSPSNKAWVDTLNKYGVEALQRGHLILRTSIIRNANPRISPDQITSTMGKIVLGLLEQVRVRGLILTGGDVAAAALKAVGARGILVTGEIEPGIPFGEIRSGIVNGVAVVTKAGAFGSNQALDHAIQKLNELQQGGANS